MGADTERHADRENRVFHDWFTHDFDDLLDGGEILDPSGKFAASFGWRTVDFRGLRLVDTVAVDVELLEVEHIGGQPSVLNFIAYDVDGYNRTLILRPVGDSEAQGAQWAQRHTDLATHLHDIAMCVFDELNPHAGLLEDVESWQAHQDAAADYDRMHGGHRWYCWPDQH